MTHHPVIRRQREAIDKVSAAQARLQTGTVCGDAQPDIPVSVTRHFGVELSSHIEATATDHRTGHDNEVVDHKLSGHLRTAVGPPTPKSTAINEMTITLINR